MRATLALLALLAALLSAAAWAALSSTAAVGRMPRTAYLIGFGVPIAASLPIALVLWRRVFPAGRLASLPQWAVALLALTSVPVSCTGPLPYLFVSFVDPIGNRNELRAIREGLTPLVEEIRAQSARQGVAPEDIAAILNRILPAAPRWLFPLGASNGGQRIRYYAGRDRYALAAWGTPPHR